MDLLRKGRKGQPEPLRPAFLRRRAARFFTVFAMLTLVVVTILYYLPTTFRISQRERVLKTAAVCTPTALTDPFNRTKVALLIETRPKVSLVPILLHYMATTPPDWPFHVIHSAENAHILASRSLQQYMTSGRLNTTLLAPGVILKDSQTCMATFPDAILPTYEESMSWAVEAQESKRYMGIHKPWGSVKVATHYDFCPEAAMLFLP
ncbi:hypothetical protein HDU90_006349 [Geranomyces variabilis]|nr:hypothetical protein HDU90_006349 [Geranomyces variabilis]